MMRRQSTRRAIVKLISGITSAILFATLLAPTFAVARAPRSGGHSGHHNSHTQSRSHGSRGKALPGVHRDAHGHIQRGAKAKHDFQKSHPCPATGKSSGACPG
jgi:hypothetical protein